MLPVQKFATKVHSSASIAHAVGPVGGLSSLTGKGMNREVYRGRSSDIRGRNGS